MSTCKCCRAACKRPLCRWPNLALASERTGLNKTNSRHSRPPRRTQQCPRRCLPRDPQHPLHQERSREPQPRVSIACLHTPHFYPKLSRWCRSCFICHVSISELSGWAAKVALPPRSLTLGSKPDACRRSWPCDSLGQSEVGLAAIKVRLSSHIAQENKLNYADFAECA